MQPATKKTKLLDDLGIIGWSSLEIPLLSFLLTGGSILLVGPHGIAKTRLAKRLAEVLGVTFAQYDASKNVWEDIVGFPDPAKLMDASLREDGKFPRIETPNTIWGKELLLVDEINRCTPETQSKWLEVILSQTLMNESTGARWIISAMNPGYAGTFPLDLALVARYTYFIPAPTSKSLTDEEIETILLLNNKDETPALGYWIETQQSVESTEELSSSIRSILSDASLLLGDVDKAFGRSVRNYLIAFTRTILSQTNYETDLRRLRMMQRSILSCLAIGSVVFDTPIEDISTETIAQVAKSIVLLSYPWVVGVDSPTHTQIMTAHAAHHNVLMNVANPSAEILNQTNPTIAIKLLMARVDRSITLERTVMTRLLGHSDGRIIAIAAICATARAGTKLFDVTTLNMIVSKIREACYSTNTLRFESAQTMENIVNTIISVTPTTYYDTLSDWLFLVENHADINAYGELLPRLRERRESIPDKIHGYVEAFLGR